MSIRNTTPEETKKVLRKVKTVPTRVKAVVYKGCKNGPQATVQFNSDRLLFVEGYENDRLLRRRHCATRSGRNKTEMITSEQIQKIHLLLDYGLVAGKMVITQRQSVYLNTIRQAYEAGQTIIQVAKNFGISKAITYKNLKLAGTTMRRPGQHKVARADHSKIKQLHQIGLSYKKIGDLYGVSRERIHQIVKK